MSIGCRTTCSSPRARPMISAGRTRYGLPGPTRAKTMNDQCSRAPVDALLMPAPSPQPSPRRGERVSTAIGVISGPSMDGIDVALIESDGEAELKTGPSATFPYPPEVAQRLRAVVADLSEAQTPQLELERLLAPAPVAGGRGVLQRFFLSPARG